MASSSFVFAVIDVDGVVTFHVDKFPYLFIFNEENRTGYPLAVVWQAEFNTMKAALIERSRIIKMSRKRRMRMILSENPNLRDLISRRPIHARPTGFDGQNEGDASGGVAAKIPTPPIRPLFASDAKAWPQIESDSAAVTI
jgi:hypothetical protein